MDKKELVVRHNRLIESRHQLSLPERRFMLFLASKIQKGDEDFKSYTIKVSEFIVFAGIKEDNKYYERLSEMADSLTKKNLGIKDEINGRYDYYSWFQKVSYVWTKGMIEAKINPVLKPFLLDLQKNYTPVYLEYLLLLRRESSHRIYELLKQYQTIGYREIEISHLREMMMMDEKKYPRYADFRRWILEPSQKEIGKKTDISFTFKPIKTGRKITGLRFNILENKPTITIEPTPTPKETHPESGTLLKRLLIHGIHATTARDLLVEYDTERVEWHIDEYEKRLISNQKPDSVGWLIKAIQEDYRTQHSLFEQQEAEEQERKKQENAKRAALEKDVALLKAECDQYNRQQKQAILEAMTEDERQAMFDALINQYGHTMGLPVKIQKEGLSNAIVFGLSLDYIKHKYPDVTVSYLAFAKGRKKRVKKAVIQALETTR